MSSDSYRTIRGWIAGRHAQERLAALEADLEACRQELEQRSRDAESYQRAGSEVEQRLAAANIDIERLKAAIETEIELRQITLDAARDSNAEVDDLRARIENTTAEITRLTTQLEECQLQVDALAHLRDQLALLTAERDSALGELAGQRERLAVWEGYGDQPLAQEDLTQTLERIDLTSHASAAQRGAAETAVELMKLQAEARSWREEAEKNANANLLLIAKLAAPNIGPNVPPLDVIDERFAQRLQCSMPSVKSVTARRHLVVPVHRPKITHISNMFSRLKVAPADLFEVKIRFIATTKEERLEIENYMAIFRPSIPAEYEIVAATELLDELHHVRASAAVRSNAHNSNINIKKIIGVYTSLLEGAEEVITLDMDVIFFDRPELLFAKARENFQRKRFFAAYPISDLMKDIVTKSAEYFSPYDRQLLIAKMKNADIYSWFFDVPYYPRKEASLFISHLQSLYMGLENSLMALNWHSFDHVLFMYFMILHSGYEMVDVRQDIREIEASDNLSIDDILRIRELHDYLPVWAPLPSIIKADERALQNLDFVVAIHSDRVS